MAEIIVARRSGWRPSGLDRGDLRHAVPAGRGDYGKSLCGVVPGAHSAGWLPARGGARVTCVPCNRRLSITARKPAVLAARFWSKCVPEPNSGCWLWTHATFKAGYGKFTKDNRTHYAHRLAYELHNGVAPGDGFVCHRCDTPACVNPDHLFLGDARANVQDMFAKGRHRNTPLLGEDHHGSKIAERDVVIIRLLAGWLGMRHSHIATAYGLTQSSIGRIVSRGSWRHVA